LWNENPAIRNDITLAADQIDATLPFEPNTIGAPRGRSRYAVQLPLAILFRVIEDDRKVRILSVKHWCD
jgi:hypothetical protein